MIEWLGVEHLFELSGAEAVAGFLTPLVVFAVFFVLQLALPGRRVPGYVIDATTGEPRNYRLNSLLVFLVVQVAWISGVTGLPHDWFYRSSVYAAAGGTILAAVLAALAVFTRRKGENRNPWLALWEGRVRGNVVLRRSHRREDVPVRGRRDDAVAQRPVGRRVPLRTLRR